jgi:uncharacterized repeat protein (TIGR01451 family)
MAKVNQHHKKTRIVAVAALVAAIVGLGVAFAALGQTLVISGTASVKTAGWDIHWQNFDGCVATGEAAIGTGTQLNANNTIVTINPEFTAPGDTVTCTFEAKNAGDLDATLASVTDGATAPLAALNDGVSGNMAGVTYTLTYTANAATGVVSGAAVGSTSVDLPALGVHAMKIVFTNANNELQITPSSETFSISLPYTQKNV